MEKNKTNSFEKSFIINVFSNFIEWGNNNLTLSHWFFNKNKNIFIKLELMMVIISFICVLFLIFIRDLPIWVGVIVSILLTQRVLEFFIVYSRNFIFNRGRVFLYFKDSQKSGQWLITMFGLNVIQILFIFAIWYQMISSFNPEAFSQQLFALNSLYYSFTTFVTVGYGDIFAKSSLAQLVVISQMAFTFYTLVIVVNGLISVHFKNTRKS